MPSSAASCWFDRPCRAEHRDEEARGVAVGLQSELEAGREPLERPVDDVDEPEDAAALLALRPVEGVGVQVVAVQPLEPVLAFDQGGLVGAQRGVGDQHAERREVAVADDLGVFHRLDEAPDLGPAVAGAGDCVCADVHGSLPGRRAPPAPACAHAK
ncbi:hypothetical protein [Actinomadura madurae]|uniref:hypothetical protein n=1 Tax=Actinomadura madurae TaxID=1993 RepID=UPI0020D23273|nr:hypothetical protein [Actinomadura madurae]MCQ0009597.1 hypothetical protein [Actinomadura madurae]